MVLTNECVKAHLHASPGVLDGDDEDGDGILVIMIDVNADEWRSRLGRLYNCNTKSVVRSRLVTSEWRWKPQRGHRFDLHMSQVNPAKLTFAWCGNTAN